MGDGGAATSAQISFPIGLRTTDGDEIITGTGLYTIRKIDTSGDISTIAGTGVQGSPPAGDGGPATSATLYQVQDLALNSAGEIFISDGNYPVRFIDGSGIIDTVIDGGLDSYLNIQFLIFDQTGTDLYFTDSLKIFRLSGGVITEVAGSGTTGYTGDGGPAAGAALGARAQPRVFALLGTRVVAANLQPEDAPVHVATRHEQTGTTRDRSPAVKPIAAEDVSGDAPRVVLPDR
jgi:hypothetical protein